MREFDKRLQAFEESERMKLLVDSMTDYAIFMLDSHGLIASWSPGAERIKGYSAGEVIGQHFSLFYTKEDRAAGVPEEILAEAAKEGRLEREGWRLRKDGSRFRALVVVDPIRDEAGNLIGYAKVTKDISEHIRAREALLESERRFRLFVQSVTDYAIFMLDPDGYVTNWNAGAERIKGYTEEEAVGQHFSRFYTEEDRMLGIPQRSLQTAVAEGKYDSEGWRIRKDGSYFRAHVVIDPVYDTDGTLAGFAKITRDITEHRKTEDDLQQARDALFQSQKMEAVGQLTGGIAHDFNNLLTVIVNSLEILSRKPLDEREKRLVTNAQIAASRGAKLTNQLLAFSRRQTLHPEVHDLNQLIGGFDSVLRGASGATVQLTFELDPGLQLTKVDSAQFEASLLNLIVNARDAMLDGGEVKVDTANITVEETPDGLIGPLEPGNYVAVTVTDTGPGIPPELQTRIFEPFFTTKEAGKGTGLGLSQVYGFASQSGGGIQVVRSDAFGTSIRLYLPASSEQRAGPDQAVDEASQGFPELVVLVVEDEEDVRESAVSILQSVGCRPIVAESAMDALKVLARNPEINVLFSDVVLQNGMDGFQLARLIHNIYPDIGIILTSGHPGRHSTDVKIAEGVQFLPKPYRMEDLTRRLESLRPRR